MADGRDQDVAVVGSPSTSVELTLDLLQEATEERLLGALVAFAATQSGVPITSVGQVVSIKLQNRWHEDSVFRNLVKRTGEIPPITNRQDTRTATLAVGATFAQRNERYDPEVLGMVPPTGTRVSRVDQQLLDRLLADYRDEIFYLGNAYANDVYFPMWLKHFASGPAGAGEAYHLGIFGKTGSGKSGLAKMVLLGYARHKEMGILIIDPQGEFSLELTGTMFGQQRLPVERVLSAAGRSVQVYRIADLQLDDWDTLQELLVSLRFTEQLGIPAGSADNSRKAAETMRNALESRERLDSLANTDALQIALRAVADDRNAEYIYSSPPRRQQLVNFVNDILDNRIDEVSRSFWSPICALFAGGANRRKVWGIVSDLLGSDDGGQVLGGNQARPIVSIDLSAQGNQRFWSEELQRRLIDKLLGVLIAQSTRNMAEQRSANVLVVLDEAHRHAPSGSLERETQADQLRSRLRRAVRETRKYGVGWLFISQTLGGLDNHILEQLSIVFFGFGLALGDEFRKLREFAGGDDRAMELYQSFRNPQSFPRRDLQEFPFMAIGPVSPLAFSGRPLFFAAFTDPQEFLTANQFPGTATASQ
jgi:hypothetical protein